MELEIGKNYDVKIVKIIKVGAIAELADGSTELIHLSNISNQFVDDVNKFVKIGDRYNATCQQGKTKPAELTLRPLDLKPAQNTSNRIEKSQSLDNTYEKYNKHKKEDEKRSLDDMISEMNADYQDKTKEYNRDRYNRRKKKFRRDY